MILICIIFLLFTPNSSKKSYHFTISLSIMILGSQLSEGSKKSRDYCWMNIYMHNIPFNIWNSKDLHVISTLPFFRLPSSQPAKRSLMTNHKIIERLLLARLVEFMAVFKILHIVNSCAKLKSSSVDWGCHSFERSLRH